MATPSSSSPPDDQKILEPKAQSRICNHDPQFLVIPPSIEFLTQYYPSISPNRAVDRSIARCKLCDLSDACELFDLLRLPNEAYDNSAPEMFNFIKEKIKSTEYLLSTGVRKEENDKALEEWKKKRADAISARKSIENTWQDVWSIWGVPDIVADEEQQGETEEVPVAGTLLEKAVTEAGRDGKTGVSFEASAVTQNYEEDEIDW